MDRVDKDTASLLEKTTLSDSDFEGHDFSTCKKKFDDYWLGKRKHAGVVWTKLCSFVMKSMFKDGKLVEFSDEALYFLWNQERRAREREIRRGEKIFFCKLCKIPLTNYNPFNHTLMIHEFGYSCPICDVADFEHSIELLSHYRSIHWGHTPLNCNRCPDVFYS